MSCIRNQSYGISEVKGRQYDVKGGAIAGCAGGANASAMVFYDLFAHGEANASSAVLILTM